VTKLNLLRAGQSGVRKSGRVWVAECSTNGIRLCTHFKPLQQRYDHMPRDGESNAVLLRNAELMKNQLLIKATQSLRPETGL
jgi:hypothetical protein